MPVLNINIKIIYIYIYIYILYIANMSYQLSVISDNKDNTTKRKAVGIRHTCFYHSF